MTRQEFEAFIEGNGNVLSVIHGPRVAYEGATYYALWIRKNGCTFPPESWDEARSWVVFVDGTVPVRLDEWLKGRR